MPSERWKHDGSGSAELHALEGAVGTVWRLGSRLRRDGADQVGICSHASKAIRRGTLARPISSISPACPLGLTPLRHGVDSEPEYLEARASLRELALVDGIATEHCNHRRPQRKLDVAAVAADIGGNVHMAVHPVVAEEARWRVCARSFAVNVRDRTSEDLVLSKRSGPTKRSR